MLALQCGSYCGDRLRRLSITCHTGTANYAGASKRLPGHSGLGTRAYERPFVPEPAPVSSPSANTPVVPRSPPEKPAISTFAEIVNRRLFTRSRRPAPKKELKVVADAPKPENLDIIGVMISPAGRMALLRTIATNEVVRAFEGQSVGGWEVSAIKPTQIVLRRGDDSEVIKMNDAPPPSVANKAPNVNNPSASGVTSSPANVLCAPAEPPPVSEAANQNFQAIRGYGYSVPYSPAYPPRQAYPRLAYMPSYGYYPARLWILPPHKRKYTLM